jgi:hypothetical protein
MRGGLPSREFARDKDYKYKHYWVEFLCYLV